MEYKQMLFDACSSNSEPRLLQLLGLKDPEISKSIAQNVFITEAVGLELFADYPHELLSNPGFVRLGKLNPQFTEDLFTRHYRVVPTLILPVTWFRYLLEHVSPDVRRAAASNLNLPKQFHEHCARSVDTALRMGIASNRNLAYDLLNNLRSDLDSQIKSIACQNPGNFSLTIKLPSPPVVATAVMNGHGTTGFASDNGASRDFAEPHLTEIQSIADAPPGVLTKLQPAGALVAGSSRGLTMMVIAALSLLSLGLLLALWSIQWGQRGALSSSQPVKILDDAAVTADVTNMNRAIEIANAASLAAKKFPDQTGWKSIVIEWTEAIALLGKIPPTSKLYPTAQSKIRTYQVILETASQNAR
jgi:nitrogen fixation-related uncharacterized protein